MYTAITGLTKAITSTREISVTVLTATPDNKIVSKCPDWGDADVIAVEARSRTHAFFALRNALKHLPSNRFDVIHAHGIWGGASVLASQWATRNDTPFIVTPHGMLEPWALRNRAIKKKLPWLLWEKNALATATALEAKSAMEAANIARLGFNNPIATIPIGIHAPRAPSTAPDRSTPRTCLFFSRIDPKKGLELLLEAWNTVRPANWRLVIAGPDGGKYQRSLEERACRLGIANSVAFTGPAYNSAKWQLLQNANLFCLPSFSENFGIVVIEALSQGLPVITTTATPWEALKSEKCGWHVPATAGAITSALHEATRLSQVDLHAMGVRGKNYAERNFSWKTVASETNKLYNWVASRGLAPASVVRPTT